MDLNALTSQIIGAAIEVHKELGPGLFESVYKRCMVVELGSGAWRWKSSCPCRYDIRGH